MRVKPSPVAATGRDPAPAYAIARGHCQRLGATPEPNGVNFAVFTRHAQQVDLLLFKDEYGDAFAEIPLDRHLHRTGDVWHVLVHGIRPDVLYGYRVYGPMVPSRLHRFDPSRVLIDPYGHGLAGGTDWGAPASLGDEPRTRLQRRSRVVHDQFDWQDDVPLNTPMGRTILYELHVRGYSRHPSSGVEHPGTFLGLCEKIPYLQSLGITAVQLMPALEFDELDVDGRRNPETGERLVNYWGYSPVSFFAPKASYCADPSQPVCEFKQMVKRFHQAGIEVILDVVYNHTCEGNENGPTLCFRGLDNSVYYLLDRKGRYYNFSGCGNTLNCNHPVVRDLIIESLVYLATEMHVDGFRFDLASVLSRGRHGQVLENPPLLEHIAEHPVLADTKLFAEAWDAAGLTQLGKFPAWGRWAELNGIYRDEARRFIRAEAHAVSSIAKRICGSVDIYGDIAHHPYHSINFITSHDGMTLHDLVAYSRKHNVANGEANRDGAPDDFSYNCGVEGPSADPQVLALRERQMRNFFVLLLTSQGVPFLLAGDEFARSQKGNNNAYCQDNDLSWVDWTLAETHAPLLRFTRMMIALRKRHFALTRDEFCNRVTWHGLRLGDPDWTGQSRALAFHLVGAHGPDFFVIYNMRWERQRFALPPVKGQWRWRRVIDTNLASPDDIVDEPHAVPLSPADHYICMPRSAVILVA